MSDTTAAGTETQIETDTKTCTRSDCACAVGGGLAAFFCHGWLIGTLASVMALIGLSTVSASALLAGVFVIGSVFIWKGFRWAGRKPALLGLGGFVTILVAFVGSGYAYAGQFSEPWFLVPRGMIAQDPTPFIVILLAYFLGWALFFAAVYYSYMTEFDLTSGSANSGLGAGLIATGICCGTPGLGAGLFILIFGMSAYENTWYLSSDLLLTAAVLTVIGATLYAKAWKQTGLVVAGGITATMLTGSMGGLFGFPSEEGILGLVGLTLPDTPAGDVVGTVIVFIGLIAMILGLFWAYYPDMELVPDAWRSRIRRGKPT